MQFTILLILDEEMLSYLIKMIEFSISNCFFHSYMKTTEKKPNED